MRRLVAALIDAARLRYDRRRASLQFTLIAEAAAAIVLIGPAATGGPRDRSPRNANNFAWTADRHRHSAVEINPVRRAV